MPWSLIIVHLESQIMTCKLHPCLCFSMKIQTCKTFFLKCSTAMFWTDEEGVITKSKNWDGIEFNVPPINEKKTLSCNPLVIGEWDCSYLGISFFSHLLSLAALLSFVIEGHQVLHVPYTDISWAFDSKLPSLQVLYIDFGNTEWVSEHDIRHLELQFIHLPPQAVECSLNRLVPRLPVVTWPDAARFGFLLAVFCCHLYRPGYLMTVAKCHLSFA